MKNYFKYSDEELTGFFSAEGPENEQVFNVLYHRYHIRVFSYFLKKLKDKSEAEDKHQETFEKFYKSILDGKKVKCVKAFLFTIARNICINYEVSKYYQSKKEYNKISLAREHISLEDSEGLECLIADDCVDSMETTELLNLIKMAIDRLESKYKEPFLDRQHLEMPIREIAEKYNLTYDGAKKRVERAMLKIKDILKPYIYDIEKNVN
jgi:RNA polymerase sigma-70 factor (ECF subfamily)